MARITDYSEAMSKGRKEALCLMRGHSAFWLNEASNARRSAEIMASSRAARAFYISDALVCIAVAWHIRNKRFSDRGD